MQKFGLIGWPIEHSLSPNIHNAGFEAEGVEASYHLVPLNPAEFAQQVPVVLQMYQGLNVTTPYKSQIMPYLDKISETAQRTGAVNTIYRDADGLLYGDTTDGLGFWQSSRIKAGETVVMIGCGGAARAIMATLPKTINLYVLNRRSPRYMAYQHIVADALDLELLELEVFSEWSSVDVVIDATSVGLTNEDCVMTDAQLNQLSAHTRIIDLKYRKKELTPLLKKAQQLGFEFMDGQAMLLEQAILSHQQWIKSEPNRESMAQGLR